MRPVRKYDLDEALREELVATRHKPLEVRASAVRAVLARHVKRPTDPQLRLPLLTEVRNG